MRRWLIGVLLFGTLLVGVSLGYTWKGNKIPKEASVTVVPSPSPDQVNKATPSIAEQSSILKDRDTLLRILSRVHDSNEGFEYTEDQLKELQTNPENKEYSKVLQQFVRSRLNKEIATFQTIGKPVNPRSILITTNDQRAYMIYLRKDYTHDGIWLVSAFKDYMPQGNEISETYKMIPIAQAPGEVKEWAQVLLKLPEWKKEYRTFGDRTYAIDQVFLVVLRFSGVGRFDGFGRRSEYFLSVVSVCIADSEKGLIERLLVVGINGSGYQGSKFPRIHTPISRSAGWKEPMPGDESTIAHLKNKIVLDAKFMELAADRESSRS